MRIVEECLSGYRQGSATARQYGIARSLVSIWRREYRSGTLGVPDAGGGFVPLPMEGAMPASTEQPLREVDDARIDITLTNGRRMAIPVALCPRIWRRQSPGCASGLRAA